MLSRRQFITLVAGTPIIFSTPALAAKKKPKPSEVVRVGLIGLGGRCQEIAKTCLGIPQMQVVAVCDCFKPRLDACMEKQGASLGWKPYLDFRKMIEAEDLDGVMVETTTHARGWIVCHAMAMGMDVYIEKPMCLTVAEGRQMVRLARRWRRVTQVGTQQRSIPLNNWASDLVQDGAVGKVKTVWAPNFVCGSPWVEKPGEPMPEGSNEGWWDVWTNQAPLRPYHHDIHRGWDRWLDYDGGGMSFGVTGWGTHSYDQINRGLGTSETGPIEVVLEEAVSEQKAGQFEERVIGPEETGAPYYGMVKTLVGPRAKVRMKFKGGTELALHLDADRSPGLGAIFEGEKGKIEINRDMISASPKELIEGVDRPAPLTVPETQPHIENWVECIKSRKRCNADVEYGLRSTTLCYLVNIARAVGKVGEPLQWNPRKERFTNCDEGNAMLSRPRREGFELPEG
ncbi:MAG: Gfo/Idh/MocA family oxidoreductase [Candidatus Hydrogenedentes bacterium]|nr:Gfo/Idh/MocA family oxidoreductase [Candidatus Hydrogenedentota bacterium]